MLRTTVITIFCVLCVPATADADIEEWGPATSGFTIHPDGTVEITAAGTYYFQSYDGETPADINRIWVQEEGVEGAVTIHIYQDPEDGEGPGAAAVKQIDLSNATESSIGRLYISANLATTGDVLCDNITGDITVGGNIATGGDVICGDITGDISVGGNLGVIGILETKLAADTISGDIVITGIITSGDRLEAGTLDDLTVGSTSGRIQGEIEVTGNYDAEMNMNRPLDGKITIGGNLTGTVNVNNNMPGNITVGEDLAVPGRIYVSGLAGTGSPYVAVEVKGDVSGEGGEAPAIEFAQAVGGVIAIDGSLYNVVSEGPEIQVNALGTHGAIAIDYDGWDDGDDWQNGASVKVGEILYTSPDQYIWHITECQGDVENDDDIDGDDEDALSLYIDSPGQFVSTYAGLQGSLSWHGDLDCSTEWDVYDVMAVRDLNGHECCDMNCQGDACVADVNDDGTVDLRDLALLLAAYGTTTGDPGYDPELDFDQDGEVGLSDLSFLLAEYGNPCDCFSVPRGGGGGGGRSTISVYVEAYDTGGYSGGGFNGEVDHFVFDLKIELSDPNDDWVATGAELDSYNDATFRLSTTATTPDQYATFVAAPWTSLPQSATASVAGAYDPADPDPEFTTTGINLAWYDAVESNDGPATIMRIVIDVSEVEGADVSEGFGSVYFSTAGPAEKEDILVADIASETGTVNSVPGLKWLSGEFYVKGEE
jgi:hypothetical protein